MRLIVLLVILPNFLLAQSITPLQQKAINNYVDYANQSADEVTSLFKSIVEYYLALHQQRSSRTPRFVCPVQLEGYFLNKAVSEAKTLESSSVTLNNALKVLRETAEQVDGKCKALDTYHKLEDYKQDNFALALKLISEITVDIEKYKAAQQNLQQELFKNYNKLGPRGTKDFLKADAMMRQQIDKEILFLSRWKLNLNKEVHTGWIEEELEKNILETDLAIKSFKSTSLSLQYPASSMWPSFIEGMQSILEVKQRGLDEYNFEAKKSDVHSNDIYLELINYLNGVLIADYNAFIGFSQAGLKFIKYVPSFEIRNNIIKASASVEQFKEKPFTEIVVSPQKASIPKATFNSLFYYVEFINETWRQVSHMRNVISNFNSSAAYYKHLQSYAGHGGLNFSNKEFRLPLSAYQKVLLESSNLPTLYAALLNIQAEVVIDILKEMQQLSAALEIEVESRNYENDRLGRVYEILQRYEYLFEAWNKKKERLYNDVRKIFDAYTPTDSKSAWHISAAALRKLTDLDHKALFQARDYYKENKQQKIETEEIDLAIREVIAKEYDNMKGIEKIGRSNGLCPYTPYEDLPVNSKRFNEELKRLAPAKSNDNTYSHPYHNLVYAYNEIVSNYNKFCELAPIPLLKTIKQPEFFLVNYGNPSSQDAPVVIKPAKAREQSPKETSPSNNNSVSKVIRDTVYIEKRDTVYLHDPGENIYSMEGYASNNMVLLLDVSGSMNAPNKLPLLKQSLEDMLTMMRQEDEVSLIVFSGKPKVILESSSFKEADKIKDAIRTLKPGGNTDGNAGLKLAYKVADQNYKRGGNNRIILATDGEFPVGETTLQLIEKFSKEDIFLTVFNFGKNTTSAKALERLVATGKGNYEYISKENVSIKLIKEAKAKKKR